MPQHQVQVHLISHTGRLKLVPPNLDDDQRVSVLRSHPETRRFLRYLPEHISVDEVRARRESRAQDARIIDFYIYLFHSDGSSSFVGQCGLFNIDTLNDSCAVGILVSPDYHRGGVATDALYTLLKFAFEDQNLHRVAFDTGVDNVAMRGWMENTVGAQLEFQWRECWKDGPGKYVDAVGYSILEWEWMGLVKAKLERKLDAAVAKS